MKTKNLLIIAVVIVSGYLLLKKNSNSSPQLPENTFKIMSAGYDAQWAQEQEADPTLHHV